MLTPGEAGSGWEVKLEGDFLKIIVVADCENPLCGILGETDQSSREG